MVATYTGTQCGAQGRVAEAGGWRMWAMPRWLVIRTRIGGGVLVKADRASTMSGYGSGGVRKEGDMNDIETIEEKGGVEGID